MFKKFSIILSLFLIFTIFLSACKIGNEIDFEVIDFKTVYEANEVFSSAGVDIVAKFNNNFTRALKNEEFLIDSRSFLRGVEGTYPIIFTLTTSSKLSKTIDVTVKPRQFPDFSNSIKILSIGDKLLSDSFYYLYNVLNSFAIKNISITDIYLDNAGIEEHLFNAKYDINAYDKKIITDGNWIKEETKTNIKQAIRSQTWDYIVIGQSTLEIENLDVFNKNLNSLLRQIVETKNRSAKIVWNMPWAHSQESDNEAFADNENRQLKAKNIKESIIKNILPNNLIEYILPTGAAIYNVGVNIKNDTLVTKASDLSDLGKYVAALSIAKSLTGLEVEYQENILTENISKEYQNLIKQGVNAAFLNPYK